MRTHISNTYSAATRTNRELRFFPFTTGRPLFAALAIAAAAIGMAVLLFPLRPADYEPYREKNIRLTGTVCSLEPRLQEDTVVWRMILSDVRLETPVNLPDVRLGFPAAASDAGNSISGSIAAGKSNSGQNRIAIHLNKKDKVLCVLDHKPEAEISSRVRVCGKLFPFRGAMNEGEFDLRKYYHILRIEFSLRDADILAVSAPTDRLAAVLFHFKNYLSSIIDRMFSTENSPVLKAMLLGEKGMLEEETKELYQGAGIIHILSISGLHLSLLGMGLFSLTGKCSFIPLPARAVLAIITVFLYGKMIGMGTSVFRALVMLTIYIISKVIGRTYDILTAASIAAFLLLLDQPLYLLHTGFQFSFGAVLAIGILLPALPGRILKAAAIPLATLPVYLWAYGTFPITSLLLNLIVIPLMTVVMVSAGSTVLLTGLIGLFSGGMTETLSAYRPLPSDGALSFNTALPSNVALPSAMRLLLRILGLPAELILDFYRFLAETSEKIPGHELVLGRPLPIRILLFYCMLLALSYVSVRLQMPHMRRRIEADAMDTAHAALSVHTAHAALSVHAVDSAFSAYAVDSVPSVSPAENQDEKVQEANFKNRTLADYRKSGSRNENRTDFFLRWAAAKICQMFHLYDNLARKNCACICTALWMAAALLVLILYPSPDFEMDMLYVGQGDGIFISCQRRHFLIDGGSSTKEDLAKYTLLPFLHSKGVGCLDGIILTHDDTDHCSGLLEFLEAAAEGKPSIAISAVYLPDIAEEAKGESYRRIEELSGQAGIPVHYISKGQRIRSGAITLDCIHPACGALYEDANEYSTTLLLRYGDSVKTQPEDFGLEPGLSGKGKGFSVLLTGDLEGRGEEDLLQYLAETNLLKAQEGRSNIDVLKVAHHGSKNASSVEFLRVVHPDLALISAGIDNMYGHPAEELLDRLESYPSRPDIYRTDLQGEISIRHKKKGDEYQVKTFLGNTAVNTETLKRRSGGKEATDVPQE